MEASFACSRYEQNGARPSRGVIFPVRPSYDPSAATNPTNQRESHWTTMSETNSLKTVFDEIASVRKNLLDITIQTAASHSCTAICSKLPYFRIQLTITFSDKYPCDELIVDFAAERNVPQGLKKKIEKELDQAAALNRGS